MHFHCERMRSNLLLIGRVWRSWAKEDLLLGWVHESLGEIQQRALNEVACIGLPLYGKSNNALIMEQPSTATWCNAYPKYSTGNIKIFILY